MIEEILDCVDGAILELECVEIDDLPVDLKKDFIQVHSLLMHLSAVLEIEMELEEEE